MIQNTKVIDNENKSSVKKRETWIKYVIDWQIFGKQMLVDGKHQLLENVHFHYSKISFL